MDFGVTMGKAEEERDILNTSGPNLGTSSSYLVPLSWKWTDPRALPYTSRSGVWQIMSFS